MCVSISSACKFNEKFLFLALFGFDIFIHLVVGSLVRSSVRTVVQARAYEKEVFNTSDGCRKTPFLID